MAKLSNADKRFIDEHIGNMSYRQIGAAIGHSGTAVAEYYKRKTAGVDKLKAECSPPHDCFCCPYPDCICKRYGYTKEEARMREIGNITTVGVRLTQKF